MLRVMYVHCCCCTCKVSDGGYIVFLVHIHFPSRRVLSGKVLGCELLGASGLSWVLRVMCTLVGWGVRVWASSSS